MSSPCLEIKLCKLGPRHICSKIAHDRTLRKDRKAFEEQCQGARPCIVRPEVSPSHHHRNWSILRDNHARPGVQGTFSCYVNSTR